MTKDPTDERLQTTPGSVVCEVCKERPSDPLVHPEFDICGRCGVALVGAERDLFRDELVRLVDQHHRTITGSKLHDPGRIRWTDCPCKTCMRVREVVGV